MTKMQIKNGQNFKSPQNETLYHDDMFEWVLYPDNTGVKRSIQFPTTVYRNFPNQEALEHNITVYKKWRENN